MNSFAIILASIGLVLWHFQLIQAQEASAVRFEVATIRENKSVGGIPRLSPAGSSQFRVANVPLRAIIRYAFGLKDHELVGDPGWIRTTKYDIAAVAPEGVVSQAQRLKMLQELLIERFRLKGHRESREVPVYRIVLANPDGQVGPQLVSSLRDCERWFSEGQPAWPVRRSVVTPTGERQPCSLEASARWISGGTQPISALADILSVRLQRPVMDNTGLPGNFDIDLQWTSDSDLAVGGVDGGAIFTAVREQLGLRLEADRGDVDVFVIDTIDRPTPD